MIYFFILFIIILFRKLPRKQYCIFICILLSLFAGLRENHVGLDTLLYKTLYDEVSEFDTLTSMLIFRSASEGSAEVGYYILEYLFSRFVSFDVFKFFCSVCTVCSASFMIYKYSTKPWVCYFIFFSLPIFTLLSMCAFRQGLAFSLFLIAMHFCFKRKWKPYVALISVAFLFHSSIICVAPVYLINYVNYKKKYLPLILIIMGILLVFSTSVFSFLNSYSRIDYEVEENAGGFGTFAYLIILYTFSFCLPSRMHEKLNAIIKLGGNNNGIDVGILNNNLILLCLYTIACWIIGMNVAALFRLAAYTEFFLCIYVTNTLGLIPMLKTKKYILLFILVINVSLMSHLVVRQYHGNTFSPYYFFWEKATYKE